MLLPFYSPILSPKLFPSEQRAWRLRRAYRGARAWGVCGVYPCRPWGCGRSPFPPPILIPPHTKPQGLIWRAVGRLGLGVLTVVPVPGAPQGVHPCRHRGCGCFPLFPLPAPRSFLVSRGRGGFGMLTAAPGSGVSRGVHLCRTWGCEDSPFFFFPTSPKVFPGVQ